MSSSVGASSLAMSVKLKFLGRVPVLRPPMLTTLPAPSESSGTSPARRDSEAGAHPAPPGVREALAAKPKV